MSDPVVGRSFGPYRVLSPLGKGGMGEVYVATDERLNRRVALKFLTQSASDDPARRARFLAEARAVSSLKHPNIVTLYDVGTTDGRDYFAMELVDGEPVRSLLRRGPLAIDKAVKIASDVAAAIAAAHSAGVIHRDLKPENIIVTPEGDAKVLDYGLAKVLPAREAAPTSTTMAFAFTDAGVIMGTVAYMSPEQAEGLAVDHRTDIFSLGIVLYEMLTGRQPFTGKSTVDQLHKIVNVDPRPARELNARVPPSLQSILEKALAKDPAWRYASAADFRLDLLRVKQDAASAQLKTPLAKRTALALPIALVAALALVAVTAFVMRARPAADSPAPDIRLMPLTHDEGYEGDPTFSADGQTIAYASDRSGNFEIYLKQVSGGPDINLTNDPADDVQPSFSPDGKEIAFVSSRSSRAQLFYRSPATPLLGGDIWVMPALGGMPRRIAEGNFPRWSPDGKSIIFTAGPWSNQKVFHVSSRGGAPVEIPVKFDQTPFFIFYPTYSPDGRWILVEAPDDVLYIVPASGGKARVIARGRTAIWNPRGDAVIYSNGDPDRNYSLWHLDFDTAKGIVTNGRPLTIGRGRDVQPAISPDGRTVAFATAEVSFNVQKMGFDAESGKTVGEPQAITRGLQTNAFFDVSPDGRSVVVESLEAGSYHLWRADEGRPLEELTNEEGISDRNPAWSPDGAHIAFIRKIAGEADGWLYVIQPDGANPQRILQTSAFLAWTPDSRGIAYFNAKDRQIWLAEFPSGKTRRLTNDSKIRSFQRFTRDGRWLLYQAVGVEDTSDIRALSTTTGEIVIVSATQHEEGHPFASPSGRWVYVQHDHKNYFRVPGPAQNWRRETPKQVTFFPESNLYVEDSRITDDGKWFFYSRGRLASDLWLMRVDKGTF